eukprot:8590056-Ditylum_brightwellii.AAC.1
MEHGRSKVGSEPKIMMSKHEPQEEPKDEPSKSNTELNEPKIEPIDMLENKLKIMPNIDMKTSQNESKKTVKLKNM